MISLSQYICSSGSTAASEHFLYETSSINFIYTQIFFWSKCNNTHEYSVCFSTSIAIKIIFFFCSHTVEHSLGGKSRINTIHLLIFLCVMHFHMIECRVVCSFILMEISILTFPVKHFNFFFFLCPIRRNQYFEI